MTMDTEEIMQNKAKELGKHETMTVNSDGKNYLLCGTCLAYEDELCDKVRDAYNLLADIFGIELDEDDLENAVSEVRDEILTRFEELTNGKIVYGSVNY